MVWILLEELDQHFSLAADFQEFSVKELVPDRLSAVAILINGCLLGAHATWLLLGVWINNKENKHMYWCTYTSSFKLMFFEVFSMAG